MAVIRVLCGNDTPQAFVPAGRQSHAVAAGYKAPTVRVFVFEKPAIANTLSVVHVLRTAATPTLGTKPAPEIGRHPLQALPDLLKFQYMTRSLPTTKRSRLTERTAKLPSHATVPSYRSARSAARA